MFVLSNPSLRSLSGPMRCGLTPKEQEHEHLSQRSGNPRVQSSTSEVTGDIMRNSLFTIFLSLIMTAGVAAQVASGPKGSVLRPVQTMRTAPTAPTEKVDAATLD